MSTFAVLLTIIAVIVIMISVERPAMAMREWVARGAASTMMFVRGLRSPSPWSDMAVVTSAPADGDA